MLIAFFVALIDAEEAGNGATKSVFSSRFQFLFSLPFFAPRFFVAYLSEREKLKKFR